MIVKVCGMRYAGNVQEVEAAGADIIGFIFHEGSPRYAGDDIPPPSGKTKRAGVFVDVPVHLVIGKARRMCLDAVQLHGSETADQCRAAREAGLYVIKAFRAGSDADIKRTEEYEDSCDCFLFDTPCESFGGSGRRFDWSLLSGYHGKVPFLLSGGLRPDSMDDLASFSHPRWAGVDLNSGFETAPGIKDAAAVAYFISRFKKTGKP